MKPLLFVVMLILSMALHAGAKPGKNEGLGRSKYRCSYEKQPDKNGYLKESCRKMSFLLTTKM